MSRTGDALVAAEPLDLLPHVGAHLGVEAGGRLVEEQDARPVDEREPDVEPPLHAAREGADDPVGGVREAEAVEQLLDAALELRAAEAVEPAAEAQVLARGGLAVGAAALGDHADRAAHLRGSARTSWPATVALPSSARASVVRMRTAVDLPAPFGPSRPNTVPSSTANDSPSSARTSPGYSLTRPSASIALLVI